MACSLARFWPHCAAKTWRALASAGAVTTARPRLSPGTKSVTTPRLSPPSSPTIKRTWGTAMPTAAAARWMAASSDPDNSGNAACGSVRARAPKRGRETCRIKGWVWPAMVAMNAHVALVAPAVKRRKSVTSTGPSVSLASAAFKSAAMEVGSFMAGSFSRSVFACWPTIWRNAGSGNSTDTDGDTHGF